MSGSQVSLADWSAAPDGNISLCFRDDTAATPFVFGGRRDASSHSVDVPGWAHRSCHKGTDSSTEFVSVADHEATLTQMLLSHQEADFCLIGGKVVMHACVHACM